MTDAALQSQSKRPLAPACTGLLPVQGSLLPPTGGAGPIVAAEPNEFSVQLQRAGAEAKALAEHAAALAAEKAPEIKIQLERAGAEAKALAGRAAALAAEKAPEIRKMAQEAGARFGAHADRAIREAGVSAKAARAAMGDPQKRRATFAAYRKKFAIGLGITIAAVGGGWTYAAHQASIVAKDQIDGFMVRNNLRGVVHYDSVSASPFGSAELSGVTVTVPGGSLIAKAMIPGNRGSLIAKIGTLRISEIVMKNDAVQAISLVASGIEIPTLALSRRGEAWPFARAAVDLGYTTLKGDVTASGRVDENSRTLSFETAAELNDFGSLRAKLQLGGLTSGVLARLMAYPQGILQSNPTAMMRAEATATQLLGQLSLGQVSLTLDDSGYFKRNRELTNLAVPADDTMPDPADETEMETDLVQVGMSPGEARAAEAAVRSWKSKGGALHIESNLADPLPLFDGGNFLTPAFTTPAEFVVAAKIRISS